MTLIEIVMLILVAAIIFYLLTRHVAPLLPAPYGNLLIAVLAVVLIIFLLMRFFPDILNARVP